MCLFLKILILEMHSKILFLNILSELVSFKHLN